MAAKYYAGYRVGRILVGTGWLVYPEDPEFTGTIPQSAFAAD